MCGSVEVTSSFRDTPDVLPLGLQSYSVLTGPTRVSLKPRSTFR